MILAFSKDFVPLIVRGEKDGTIRKPSTQIDRIKVGMKIDFWERLPFVSGSYCFGTGTVKSIREIFFWIPSRKEEWYIRGLSPYNTTNGELEQFAKCEGFENFDLMSEYMRTYLPLRFGEEAVATYIEWEFSECEFIKLP